MVDGMLTTSCWVESDVIPKKRKKLEGAAKKEL